MHVPSTGVLLERCYSSTEAGTSVRAASRVKNKPAGCSSPLARERGLFRMTAILLGSLLVFLGNFLRRLAIGVSGFL